MGGFSPRLPLTDLATGWTECLPLLEKSAAAVLAALAQARTLFPFPLLGIDTDNGAEFLNAEVMAYCEQEQLTFTGGRPGIKNDQCHVEQKNGAVVRKVVGCARLIGVQAYRQLREIYQVLRLVVNCFQPSLKLQAHVLQGERARREYDVAQTPLQRLLASGVLSGERFAPRAINSDRGDANHQHGGGLCTFGACLLQLAGSPGVRVRSALSARPRPQNTAGPAPGGGARGVCSPVACLSASR
jgi:hypothetical protein